MAKKINIIEIASRLRSLWIFFSKKRRTQFLLLIMMMILSAFAEVLSLGSVIPFLSALTSPENFFSYPSASYFIHLFGALRPNDLLLPLSISFALLALFSGLLRVSLLWLSTRLTAVIGAELSQKVFACSLNEPYISHISRNTSDVINGVINSVNTVLFGVIQPVLIFFSSLVLLIVLMIALVVISPTAALISMASFGTAYLIITFIAKTYLFNNLSLIHI